MTTAAQLVAETKRHLYSGYGEELNRLSGAIDAAATTLTLEFAQTGVARGTVLSIDLEELYVWGVSGSDVTVQRGWNGSTAAAHLIAAPITVNPKFSDFRIFDALNTDINDLSSPANGLYRVLHVDLTYSSEFQAYDLTSVGDVIGEPLLVLARASGSSRSWSEIRRWRYTTNQEAADFASGKSLTLFEAAYQGNDVRVFYKAPFAELTALVNDVETVTGLPSTAVDIPPLGAADLLLAGRPVKRAFTEAQSNSRRAEEVSVVDVLNSGRGLAARRQRRIIAEATRLRAQHPNRSHRVGL